MKPLSPLLFAALLVGCNFNSNQVSVLDDDGQVAPDVLTAVLADYEARLDALEAENAALRSEATVHQNQIAALLTEVGGDLGEEPGLEGSRLDLLEDDVDELALTSVTMEDVEDLGYATESWVQSQGYADDVATGLALDALDVAKIGLIDVDTTVTVDTTGGDFSSLDAALTWLDGYRIGSGVTVSLEVAAGTWTLTETLEVDHPDGAQLAIIGGGTEPGQTILVCDEGGVMVDDGRALGLLDNLRIEAAATSTYDGHGVLSNRGGSVNVGTIEVDGFVGRGIYARAGSTISVGAGTTVSGCDNAGFMVRTGSSMIADGTISTGNLRGYQVAYGSVLEADGLTASNNGSGLWVSGSTLQSQAPTVTDNTGSGLFATNGADVSVRDATFDANLRGISAQGNTYVDMDGTAVTNSTGDYGVESDIGSLVRATGGASSTGNTGPNWLPTPTGTDTSVILD